MKIILIRHGFSLGNKQRLLIGWTDTGLAEEGIAELEKNRKEIEYPIGDAYYCSDLVRCKQTLSILYPDADNIIYEKGFREVRYGCFDGLSDKQIDFKSFFDSWLAGKQLRDEENRIDFGNRVMKSFEQVLQDCCNNNYSSAVIICHSGVIKHILLTLQNISVDHYFDKKIANGKGVIIDLNYVNKQIIINNISDI